MAGRSTSDKGGLESLIAEMQRKVESVVRPLLPDPGEKIALIDFPNYNNVGDSAIWLGTRRFLRQQGFHDLAYTCEIDTYSRQGLTAAIDGGTILLNGGGNFGDLWIEHQEFREQIIIDFPDNRVIQLAQSICFLDEGNLLRAKDICRQHSDLTVLVRDNPSLDVAGKKLGVSAYLCPDMAFWLGRLKVRTKPSMPRIWLYRNDKESQPASIPDQRNGTWMYDWTEDDTSQLERRNKELLRQYSAETGSRIKESIRLKLSDIYTELAQGRVNRASLVLARGRTVTTDRLHGHILCLLLGIPHQINDTRYGKVKSFIETWKYRSPLIHWCGPPQEALQQEGCEKSAKPDVP